jgi:hypothetical protein
VKSAVSHIATEMEVLRFRYAAPEQDFLDADN